MAPQGRPKKAKGDGKRARTGTPPKEDARMRELEARLAEALKREVEAVEQQAATGEILRAISRSPAAVEPVFETIIESAVRARRV